ncbi:MAG: type I DNA topoisomerase [Deltaproteobacteria bacterium]|nr:type I DNA topoisomerase [Deltaproteobacteria bacterium]
MAKALVIVESPTKANTIKKYLGAGYQVKASVGHIKDLPTRTFGVDIKKDFTPTYELIKGKKKVVDDILAAAEKASAIFLAPDPDREGEAIAWHIAETIRDAARTKRKTAKAAAAPKGSKKRTIAKKTAAADGAPTIHRVLFHEITAPAVKAALAKPVALDANLYEAQQARRILDRIVGYQISPLLWDKVRRGLSAGRVQSVALRILCEREAAIRAFVPVEYWSIVGRFEGSLPPAFEGKLIEWAGKKPELGDAEASQAVVTVLGGARYTLQKVTKQERRRNPAPPFITSKLQQEAARKLGFSAKKTMMLAQRLYEGVDLGQEGPVGLITYMRTDSVRVAESAVQAVRDRIAERYGATFIPENPNIYRNKKGAQDAHEAIRPTLLDHPPDRVQSFLERDAFRLYELIWKRFVASQMVPAVFDQTSFDIAALRESQSLGVFRATGSVMKFQGFMAVYLEDVDDAAEKDEEENPQLPDLAEGTALACHDVAPHQHFTQPPPRFSEASLVKELEEQGIGRPSTYAAILSTLQEKEYARKENARFTPTQLGEIVNDLLVGSFPDIIDVKFTAQMEEELDEVEEGKRKWIAALRDFYRPFARTLEKAKIHMRDVKRQEIPTDHVCEKCGSPMVIKWGRHGEFLACSAYPECKSTKEFRRENDRIVPIAQETTDEVCPACGAPMLVKRGRFGRFLACSKYPECKTTKGISIGVQCPTCGGPLVEKRSRRGKAFYSCGNYPTCTYAIWDRPIPQACPQCRHPFLLQKYSKKSGPSLQCPNKDCGYRQLVAPEGEEVS